MKTEIISDQWTTRELRSFIRETTASINYKLLDYYETEPNPNPVVNRAREKLIALGTGKETRGGFIGLGLTYKTKSELIEQARALAEFEQIDIYTPQALKEYSEKEQKAYNTFIKNRPDLNLSIDEYHDLVEAFGALGSKLIDEFGYNEMAQTYSDASSKQKHDLVKAVVDIKRESKGQGMTREDINDKLRERLGIIV